MKLKYALAGATAAMMTMPAMAQLEVYTDYDVSEDVWAITTVKVDSNMGDYYLEGLKSTWVQGNEIAKELGHIEDYIILSSALSESGDFNLMLGIKYASAADMSPSKEKYDAFMAAWGEDREETTREIVKMYPEIRKITGEYVMREITMIDGDE